MVVVCLSIFILLFGIFSVSASDNTVNINDNLTNMESNMYDDLKVDNQKLSNFEDEKLNDGIEYNFEDLQNKIDAAYAGGELNLDAGDLYNNTDSKLITISNALTINGNGATISGATSFTVTGGNVVLKNIKYINSRAIGWNGLYGTLSNCSFVNNVAINDNGSAVYWSGDYGTLKDCFFINNTASNTGGAVYWYGASGTLMNCSFVGNVAKNRGGAVYLSGSYGVLGNCSFVNNTARDYGGAVFLSGSYSVLDNCSFVNNNVSASNVGGGAVYWQSNYGVLRNSFFFNNKGYNAATVYWAGSYGVLGNCSFVNNTASNNGGAVYLSGANGTLMNCSFVGNVAKNSGGAVYLSGSYGVLGNCSFVNNSMFNTNAGGGAVLWQGSYGVLKNSFFCNNKGYDGGAVSWKGGNGVLGNCSFVKNTASQYGGAVLWDNVNGVLGNCSFVNQFANFGAAVNWKGAYGTLLNSSFVGGSVINDGGAVYWIGDNGVLGNCSFSNNRKSNEGGAVCWRGANGTLVVCSFVNNAATQTGGAVYWDGKNCTLSNCSFVNNSAGLQGGAVSYNIAFWTPSYSGVLVNCSFFNNKAYRGGAVFWDNHNGTLLNCSFVNNTATDYGGGAVYLDAPNCVINKCYFANNTALNNGGAVYMGYYNGTIRNSRFISNQAKCGSAIYVERYGSLFNCYFYRNLNNLGQGIYLKSNCNISNCQFDMTKIYINSGKIGLINNVELSYQNNFTANYGGELFLSGNNLKSYIYNKANITSPVTMIALNNQTVKVFSNKTDVTALIYDDNKNIIVDDDLRICVGSTVYNATFDGVNYIAFGCDVPENDTVVSVKLQRPNSYDNITFKNGLLSFKAHGFKVDVDFYVVKNDLLILFNVTPTSFKDNLTVLVANGRYSVKISDGKGNISVKNLPAGNYAALVYYPGSNDYDYYDYSFNFTVNLLPSQVNITVGDYYAGSDVVIGVNLTSGASGLPLIYVDNKKVNYTALGDINLGKLAYGNHTVSVIYAGDNYHDSSFNMIDFFVKKVNSTISLNIADGSDDASKNIIVEVTNGATGDVLIDVNGVVYKKTLSSSKTTLMLDNLKNGTYAVVATYLGDEIYNSNFTSGSFEINTTGVGNFTVHVDFNVVDNDVLILFNVTPTSFNDNLTVFINNDEYSVNIADGKGNLSLKNLPADNYVMMVYYPGNDDYSSYLHLFNFTVNLLPSQINITVGDYYAGSDVIIGVNLTSGASGLPIIYVDNKKVDYNALGDINLGKLAYGNHSVSVIYAGDGYYNSSFKTADFSVKRNNTTIALNIADGSDDRSKKITVEVTNGATGDVLIDVNGVVYKKTLSSSKTTLMLDNLKNGNYTVVATYLGDEIYNSNFTSGSFEINASGPANFTANVTVIIDGKNYTGIIVDGVYHVDLSNATPGIYNATVIYRDEKGDLINTTMTFAIPKWNSNVDVNVFNIRMGEVETIVVNVTRGATGTVLIDVNGTVYYKVLENSRAELVLSNLKSGNYPVRVIYMGDDKYNNSTNRAEFIVGDGVIVSVFMDGKNPMLDVIVPEDATGSVTVTINNKDYTGVVDNRHAIINISDVAPNTYNITTSYTNTSGSIIKGNATITVPKPLLIATVISVEYVSKDLMVTSVLKDIDGNVLPNEEITYSMNGVINKTTTDREGLFKVKYVSNSTLYIEYAGNNVYEGSNTTIILDKFVDLRNATKIISEVYDTYAVDFELGERGGYFKFRLVDENGNPLANKPVQIGFCGVVYNRVTDSEGNAQLQINLNTPFIFTFAIAFLGDDTHNASFVVQQINVAKKTTSISAASKSYKANEKTKKFTVTLKSDKCSSIDGKTYLGMNKKITLKVNGKTYTAKTNALNQATFKLSINKKGTYNAEIRFDGDQRYAASKTTAKIKIV